MNLTQFNQQKLVANRKFIVGFFVCCYVCFPSFGQDQEKDGGIPNAEIVITKDRKITLPKADRNFEKIPPRQQDQFKTELTYEVKNLRFNSADYNPILRPLKLKDQEIPKIYSNYFAAGFGNYASPYLEGFLNSKRDRNKLYGVNFYHHSFGSGAIDNANSASGKTEIGLYGKLIGQIITVGGKFDYSNTGGNFYGYVPKKDIKKDTIEQTYSRVGFQVNLENSKQSDFTYKVIGGFNLLSDKYKASENEMSIKSKFGYTLAEVNKLNFGFDFFLLTRQDAKVNSYARQLIKIKPAYEFSPIDNLKLIAGANVAFQNDPQLNINSVHLFPNIYASYKISESVLSFAQITGDVDKVSLNTISGENFWINSNQAIKNTINQYEYAAGLKGKIVSKISFSTGLSFANLKGYYFYVSDLKNRAKFDLTYEDGGTKRTNLYAELGFNQEDRVKLNVRADYFSYLRDTGLPAYHRPAYRVALNSTFNVYNKLVFNIDCIALGGMKAFDNEKNASVNLNSAMDVSVKTDYLLSKHVSLFLKFNNLLSSDYQIYLNYPVRGFQAMGGITCSF